MSANAAVSQCQRAIDGKTADGEVELHSATGGALLGPKADRASRWTRFGISRESSSAAVNTLDGRRTTALSQRAAAPRAQSHIPGPARRYRLRAAVGAATPAAGRYIDRGTISSSLSRANTRPPAFRGYLERPGYTISTIKSKQKAITTLSSYAQRAARAIHANRPRVTPHSSHTSLRHPSLTRPFVLLIIALFSEPDRSSSFVRRPPDFE